MRVQWNLSKMVTVLGIRVSKAANLPSPSTSPHISMPPSLHISPCPPSSSPQVVTMQPQASHVFIQSQPAGTKLPVFALFTSLIVTLIFAGFCCYIPGLLCLIPAVSTALCVSVAQWSTAHCCVSHYMCMRIWEHYCVSL